MEVCRDLGIYSKSYTNLGFGTKTKASCSTATDTSLPPTSESNLTLFRILDAEMVNGLEKSAARQARLNGEHHS